MNKLLDYDGARVMDTYEQQKNMQQMNAAISAAMGSFTHMVWVGTTNNAQLLSQSGVQGTSYTLGTWSTSDQVDGANLEVVYDAHTIYIAPLYAVRGAQVIFDLTPQPEPNE